MMTLNLPLTLKVALNSKNKSLRLPKLYIYYTSTILIAYSSHTEKDNLSKLKMLRYLFIHCLKIAYPLYDKGYAITKI